MFSLPAACSMAPVCLTRAAMASRTICWPAALSVPISWSKCWPLAALATKACNLASVAARSACRALSAWASTLATRDDRLGPVRVVPSTFLYSPR
ncbi:hypothetical protein D3C86_2040240 [compost metagenome]